MNIGDLNTVDMNGEGIVLASYNSNKKDLKGLKILDGTVRDMVAYKHKANGRKEASVWEVIDADGLIYYMKDQDIKHLYRKSMETFDTTKLIQQGKTIKVDYLGHHVRVEVLGREMIKPNSVNAKHVLDFALNVIFDRFTVLAYVGKVGNQNFQTTNGWYCIDSIKNIMVIMTDEQISKLKSKQNKIKKKVRKKNESKLTAIQTVG